MKRRNFLIGCVATCATVSFASEKEIANATNKHHIQHKEDKKQHKTIFHVRYHKHVKVNMTKFDKNVLIETIWGETRGESNLGKMAVVHLVLNRHFTDNSIFKKQKTISQLCLKKYQFSCWLNKFTMKHIKKDDTYKEIVETVEKAIHLYEKGIDYSNGALFYYSIDINKPKWAKEMKKVNEIGKHRFYA